MAETKTPLTASPSAAHTPLPWYIFDPAETLLSIRARGPIVSGVIATVNTRWPHENQKQEQRANAEFIVRAVNSHQDLLDACKGIISTYVFLDSLTTDMEPYHTNTLKALAVVRAAIQKAEADHS